MHRGRMSIFFDCRGKAEEGSFGGELSFAKLIDKTLCSDRFEVAILEEIDFEYKARDSSTNDLYGTKVGHQILEFYSTGHCRIQRQSKTQTKPRDGTCF